MFSHLQLTEAGAIQRYIPAGVNIEWDANNFCTAEALVKDGKAEQFRVVEFFSTIPPAHDKATHKAVEADPQTVDGVWTQQWSIVALTQEEIDAAAKAKVPQVVTRRQAKQALRQTLDANGATLLSKVQPAIDAILDPLQRDTMQIEWDESLDFVRTRPSLIQMGAAIGLDSAGIDQLFILAATL